VDGLDAMLSEPGLGHPNELAAHALQALDGVGIGGRARHHILRGQERLRVAVGVLHGHGALLQGGLRLRLAADGWVDQAAWAAKYLARWRRQDSRLLRRVQWR